MSWEDEYWLVTGAARQLGRRSAGRGGAGAGHPVRRRGPARARHHRPRRGLATVRAMPPGRDRELRRVHGRRRRETDEGTRRGGERRRPSRISPRPPTRPAPCSSRSPPTTSSTDEAGRPTARTTRPGRSRRTAVRSWLGEDEREDRPGSTSSSGPLALRVQGANFVEAIRKQVAAGKRELSVVDDQVGSPTCAPDLAAAILDLLAVGARGIVHAVNDGATTWHGFAAEIVRGWRRRVHPPDQLGGAGPAGAAPRQLGARHLAPQALLGRPLPPWQDALARYLGRQPVRPVQPGPGT